MENPIKTIALYTTIYPGVEPFLKDWYRSVLEQTDQDYQLWIGLDTMEIEVAQKAMSADPKATWVVVDSGGTPAQIRQMALARIVEVFDGVVLVDSDDILHASRVAAAREALQTNDLAGCALRLVDQNGRDLGLTLGLPAKDRPDDVLPGNNIFGLSNSAFRSELLRRCLPIPANAVLVDWFLAAQAWLYGAGLAFDPIVRMDYRQHEANMARIMPPFSRSQIIKDTERVRHHFQVVRAASLGDYLPDRLAALERVASDIELFYQHVVLQSRQLEHYVQALNEMEIEPLWGSSVANPRLGAMWNSRETSI